MPHNEKDYLNLKAKIAEMSMLVSKMIQLSIQALLNRDIETAFKIIEMDKKVDQLDINIDELCLKILALYDPKANDLRYILGASRVIVDLERIGDYSTNICREIIAISKLAQCDFSSELSLMGKLVIEMIKGAINAFFQRDIDEAKEVIQKDGEVNDLNSKIIQQLMSGACDNPEKTQITMCIMAIARSLERIGDHAKNIAESAHFLVGGKFIRHTQFEINSNE